MIIFDNGDIVFEISNNEIIIHNNQDGRNITDYQEFRIDLTDDQLIELANFLHHYIESKRL